MRVVITVFLDKQRGISEDTCLQVMADGGDSTQGRTAVSQGTLISWGLA